MEGGEDACAEEWRGREGEVVIGGEVDWCYIQLWRGTDVRGDGRRINDGSVGGGSGGWREE